MTGAAFDVAVVGAGPAGLAAAACAGESGARVVLIDDNPGTGGQIWRNVYGARARRMRERVRKAGVSVRCGTSVVQREDGGLLAQSGEHRSRIDARAIVLAVGARELFLPFPGWTLPNVLGVGGLQSLVKTGWDIGGKRVVIAGSGPLLLAVAAFLRSHRAKVLCIAEQAPASAVRRFAAQLVGHPSKLMQGAALKMQLLGVPYRMGTWPVRAAGDTAVRAVTLTDGSRVDTMECDILACAFGLTPNLHLPAVLGCRTEAGFVLVDDLQTTSVADIYCAGEPTGIGGVDVAEIEGSIAGFAAAGDPARARRLWPRRARANRFASALNRAFAIRDEVRRLALPETTVCRCEDVDFGRLRACGSWRDAKLQTRCGMGPCQGRVCGPAAAEIMGWAVGDARPPILPVPLGALVPSGSERTPKVADDVPGAARS